jgi:anti-sigma factor RsiW
MSDLDPAELSAFLDGELDPVRAAQVAAIIESDEAARDGYESLKEGDAQWRSMARSVAFRPRVKWPRPAPAFPAFPAWAAAALLFILVASFAAKLTGAMAQSLALNTLSLLALVSVFLVVWSGDRAEARPAP